MHPLHRVSLVSSWSSSARSPRWTYSWLVGAICLLGILALAGCGASASSSGTAGKGSPSKTPVVIKGGIASINPCPGTGGPLSKTPTRVLTVKDSHKTIQAHTGDVIEVQLTAKMAWTVQVNKVVSLLKPLQPQGGVDGQTNSCRWLYSVSAPGTAKLVYTGVPLCEGPGPCPAIAEDEEFTIQAS